MNNKNLLYITMNIILFLFSQTMAKPSSIDTIPASKGITIAYRTNFDELQTDWHIGVLLGFENYYVQNKKYTVIGLISLMMQRKPDIYTSAGVIIGHAIRRTYKPGIFLEHCFTVGYVGSYYDFDLFKTNSDGAIINIGRTWMNSGIVGYSLGVGFDLAQLTRTNLQVFFKPAYYLRFPNNDNLFLFNNYCLEIGITIHPKWLESSRMSAF